MMSQSNQMFMIPVNSIWSALLRTVWQLGKRKMLFSSPRRSGKKAFAKREESTKVEKTTRNGERRMSDRVFHRIRSTLEQSRLTIASPIFLVEVDEGFYFPVLQLFPLFFTLFSDFCAVYLETSFNSCLSPYIISQSLRENEKEEEKIQFRTSGPAKEKWN